MASAVALGASAARTKRQSAQTVVMRYGKPLADSGCALGRIPVWSS
jgi:hypothetical protein